ncbi:MAG: DUF4350 domain-containing protein [Candidatus Methylacidiphilales bacterium]|nr:DUF4350 domain-containing protein [Candidatus Methylacidiphilales bacterium]
MKSDTIYIRALLTIVGVVAVLAFLFGRPSNPDRDLWLPSTFNPEPRGTKAIFVTLSEMGWPVARWQQSYADLSQTGTGNVMVFSRSGYGQREPFVANELNKLFAWIKEGNHFVVLGPISRYEDGAAILARSGYPLPQGFKPPTEGLFERGALLLQRDKRGSFDVLPPEGSPFFGKIKRLILERGDLLHKPPATGTVLFATPVANEPAVVRMPVGAGTVTFVSSPSVMDNGMLREADNLRFVLDVLRPEGPNKMPPHIWFEETHHGYRITYRASELLDLPGLRLAGLQILLGIMIFISSQMVRFGLIVPLPREQVRATMEFVSSMAKLYRRADLRDEVMHVLYEDTLQRVLKKLNMPENSSHDEISRLLGDAFPQLPRWKKIAQQFDNKGIYVEGLAPSGWMKVARELIAIKNAMI